MFVYQKLVALFILRDFHLSVCLFTNRFCDILSKATYLVNPFIAGSYKLENFLV